MAITGIAAIIDGKTSDFSFKTVLGWRKFIIGAQDPTNAHWCNLWDLWYVKLALEWYQVVLGCLRVHKNVFTKIAITEVNFSHRPKIAILWVGPNCTHLRQLLYVQLTWCKFGASTTTRKNFGPPEVFLKTVLWDDFFQAVFCQFTGSFWN